MVRFVRRVARACGEAGRAGDRPLRCPACGWSQERYRDTGYTGCPLCYPALGIDEPNADNNQESAP